MGKTSVFDKGWCLVNSLFDPTQLNGMSLKNRLMRSATWEGMCRDDGMPTQKLINCYRDLAAGGVGLIISGYAFVRWDGKQARGQMGINSDGFMPQLESMAQAVHNEGGRICVQMVHGGGQANSEVIGVRPLAPSAVQAGQYSELPQEMNADDIESIIKAFGEAAYRAKSAGMDAVQLHGAHGYMINQFLSPHLNKRKDEYGGGIEDRIRFVMRVYETVRTAVGPDYPVLIKLNAADYVDGGLELEDAVYAAKSLDSVGLDAIEVSSGTRASGKKIPPRMKITEPDQEAYNLGLARAIKAEVECPVISVGGFRSFDLAQSVIAQGQADYISMSRPLIREPDLMRRWQSGDTGKAECISCNGCFQPASQEGGIYCVVKAKQEKKG